MANTTVIGSANFYSTCPKCGKMIPFQGVDIQYYQPIGTELDNELYDKQEEVMNTGKVIACPFCKEVSKAKDFTFFINDF